MSKGPREIKAMVCKNCGYKGPLPVGDCSKPGEYVKLTVEAVKSITCPQCAGVNFKFIVKGVDA